MAYRQFSKVIKTSIGSREFNFLQRTNQDGVFYNTDVADERGDRFQFDMKFHDGEWKVSGGILPAWINNAEKDLHEVISAQHENAAQRM
jgi:hypothetical protein